MPKFKLNWTFKYQLSNLSRISQVLIGQPRTVPIGWYKFWTELADVDTDVIMKVETGLPFFLENYPAVICDQVLWLIKNSGLNFQVKETPFSLDINPKKNFVKVWNQTTANPVLNQCTSQFSQHVKSEEKPSPQSIEVSDLLQKVETLKANLDEALREKTDAREDLFQTDQAHRKQGTRNSLKDMNKFALK